MTEPITKVSKVESWPVSHLIPYELNVKKHEKEQVARIVASIQRFGWRGAPIVVDRDGVIIAGHGRRLAALELGMSHVPVVVASDLSPEKVKALRLSDNRSAISDIDSDKLRLELEDISVEDLEGIFDLKELEFLDKDPFEINEDAFVDDMDKVLTDQREETAEKAAAASEARVPLTKAFGFKDIPVTGQIAINRLMAKAEAVTGLTGGEALTEFAGSL